MAGGVDVECAFDVVDDEEVEYDLLLLCEFHEDPLLPLLLLLLDEKLVNENDRVDWMVDDFSILRPIGKELFDINETNMAKIANMKQYLKTLVGNIMYS